jgi:Ran-binding protein 1
VVASIKMQEHAGSDKSCVWHALDFADGELKEEMFAIRFGSVESEYPIHLYSFRVLVLPHII